MNGKSLVMLSMAVLCGLGAMYGTSRLIGKQKPSPVVEMQDVLVAARDLKIEEVIKPEVVKVVRMAKAAVPVGAMTGVKDVADRWVQIGILEGEPVVDRKLAPRGTPPGLVARIPLGMRAFAIEVNEQTGVSGFILPDHRVDVVQIQAAQNGKQPEAETVLQNVLVLASGQTFTRPDDRSIQARTVTLAVKPNQVDELVAARSRGPLSLSLRGLNDHAQTVRVKKPEPAPEPAPAPPPAPEPKLEPEPVALKQPEPAAPAPAPRPRPARYLVLYRGVENISRVRLDPMGETSADEGVVATPPAPEAATVAAAPRQ